MDVAHGPSPVHNGGSGPGISAGATSPPPPPRPAIPPKPDKDKIGVKSQTSLSSGPCSPVDAVDGHAITIQPGSGSGAPVAPNFRTPITAISSNSSSPKSPPTPVLTPPTPASSDNCPGTRPKPALPPKPPSVALHTSPPAGKFPLKPPPKFPATNANAVNNNVTNAPPAQAAAALNGEHTNGNGTSNGYILSPPLPFLRAKPPQSPGDPLSPRPFLAPRSPNSRPNSFFNFASPPQNLNSSTSGGLNQSGAGGGPSPQKLAPIRAKSASLGRNVTPPTSFTSGGGGGIGGIFSRKSSTLSKFLPLDLHIGNRGPPPQPPTKPAKSFTLNLNPFIQQQKERQQMSQKVQSGQAIQNLGRSISFSPESPLPPPPPPRQRKKLSPVNSIGSPTSPTSASPIHSSLSPTSPLPMPPPISPAVAMDPVAEAAEEGKGAIYAEVDKERKWAERKLKEQQIQPVSSQNSNKTSVSGYSDIDNYEKVGGPPTKPEAKDTNNIVKGECAVVNSWLGKYLQKPVTTEASSARASSPTYQSANTGHIYETIGSEQNAITSPDNSINRDAVEIQESSEVVVEDDLSVNQSFLFKLVISHKKVEESAKSCEEPVEESVQSTVDTAPSSPPPPQSSSAKIEEVVAAPDAILIPTVVQDLSEETSPQTESNAKEAESSQKDEATTKSPPNSQIRDDEAAFTSQSSVCTDSTIASTETPSRSNSILRRRSWNCDRVASPSLSESSSSTTSSSNLPYHKRDRSYTCHDKKGFLQDEWIDEGDLSHGVLADAESSDNLPLRSSAEDIAQLRGISIPGGGSTLSKASFASRRSRFVDSIFSSFGKGSSSSSGGGYAVRPRPVTQNMRHVNGGNKRPKEKARSHVFPSDPLKGIHPDIKFGRQVSDSVMPTTTMISGPILPSPAVQSLAGCESGILVHKPQSVQFSAEVVETRIIYPAQNYSSEEGDGNNNALCQDEQNVVPITPEGGEEKSPVITREGDNESVSSSESASGSGSLSGYEDILAELSPKEKKSFYVAREILTSERTFVEVLNLLTIDFPRYLHNTSKYHGTHILSKEDLDMILGGLPNLKRVNEDLLTDLENRILRWRENPKIADILVKKGPFLKLYATYIKDFQKNSMHLDTCCQRHPLFAATVKEFELSERCQRLGLKHYMLKPVQRMPQYRLLLEDYLKSLDKEENEDYQETIKGIAIVKDVAEHANEAIRLQVNTDKLHHLQNRLAGGTVIMESNRQLLKEGELLKVCRKVLQPRFFVLMNDCVLCCTYYAGAGAPKDLKLRYELPLAGMRVLLSPAEDYQFEFTIISVARSFNLVAKTAREREEWMKALDNAIHDNIKKRTCSTPDYEIGFQIGKEAPVWIQDSRVTMCQQCTAEFTITFRRHHCRACGKVVCGNCSGNEAPLQYLKNAAARVCDSCYEHLLEEYDNLGGLATDESDTSRASIRDKFKKVTPNVSKRANKIKRSVPARLEVHANSSGSRISGYLHWREREKKSWKRRWFVLIDRVLYIYAASEDIVAIKSIPLLGWQVELDKSEQPQDSEENHAVFRLTHLGHPPIHFQADNLATAEKWVAAMIEVVVL